LQLLSRVAVADVVLCGSHCQMKLKDTNTLTLLYQCLNQTDHFALVQEYGTVGAIRGVNLFRVVLTKKLRNGVEVPLPDIRRESSKDIILGPDGKSLHWYCLPQLP
jgi:hypothetical protein